MPKKLKDFHEGIPYYLVRKGSEPGCYQLHKPSVCRQKFPPTQRPIHKCELIKKKTIMVPGKAGWRPLVVPSDETNYYPLVMDTEEFERLRSQAKIISHEDQMRALDAADEAFQQQAKAAEERKQMLKMALRPQPGAAAAAGGVDPELEGPDQTAHTLSRAEQLKAENMQGPRLANQIILASKCHAIRDAQILEKELMKKELTEEERRLDSIMEENRVAAEKRAKAEENRIHDLRLQNLAALKEQIKARETAKILEAERIEEESIRMNQANIAMQIDEAHRMKQKHAQQQRLKEMLDQGNAEILYYKQLQIEEERITDQRISAFLKAKQEREIKNKGQAEAIKNAKLKGIDHIAKAQKAEQALKEELEKIRTLKIQEDVERDYRRKEREAAIKKNRIMKDLHESRSQQISDIHRNIAREIAKDEQSFNNAARQNEEYLQKERIRELQKKARTEQHRQAIMKQINDKERARAEYREKVHNQGVALRLEQEQQDKYENMVIKKKVAGLRQAKVAEKYVKEVEQTLAKHDLYK